MFVGCARKYEQSKKGVIKELFSEIGVVLVRKGETDRILVSVTVSAPKLPNFLVSAWFRLRP